MRQYPTHFGLGTYFVTDRNPEVVEEGLRFCQEIGLRGLANVEFKRDPRDGSLKMIEVQPPLHALSTRSFAQAGIDIATFDLRSPLGRPVRRMPELPRGVRLWAPLEDLRRRGNTAASGELSGSPGLAACCIARTTVLLRVADPGRRCTALEEAEDRLRRC